MKKLLLIIFILFLTLTVEAKDNKLYFVEDDETDRIVYESGSFDENIFISHLDMIPGRRYVDTLIIENGTNTTYTLYFKVEKRELTEAGEKLLDNIVMRIVIDDVVIYEGKANGMGSLDLNEAVSLGEVIPGKEYTMVVDTYLSTEYTNPVESDRADIDWAFYAQYEREEPEPIVPITGKNSNRWYIIIAFMLIAASGILIGSSNYYKDEKAN